MHVWGQRSYKDHLGSTSDNLWVSLPKECSVKNLVKTILPECSHSPQCCLVLQRFKWMLQCCSRTAREAFLWLGWTYTQLLDTSFIGDEIFSIIINILDNSRTSMPALARPSTSGVETSKHAGHMFAICGCTTPKKSQWLPCLLRKSRSVIYQYGSLTHTSLSYGAELYV